MKKTYEDIIDFVQTAAKWKIENNETDDNKPLTKFGYALMRVQKPAIKKYQEFQELLQEKFRDIDIDKAATEDVKGKEIILTDENGKFRFEPKKLKEADKEKRVAQKELLETAIEIEPYYATEVPDDLSETYKEAFLGFVIREEEEVKAEGTSA